MSNTEKSTQSQFQLNIRGCPSPHQLTVGPDQKSKQWQQTVVFYTLLKRESGQEREREQKLYQPPTN